MGYFRNNFLAVVLEGIRINVIRCNITKYCEKKEKKMVYVLCITTYVVIKRGWIILGLQTDTPIFNMHALDISINLLLE